MDIEKIKAWFNEKIGKLTCECSGNTAWQLIDGFVVPIPYGKPLPPFDKGRPFNFNAPISPQIMVMRKKCANTKYFNAVMMEIIQKEVSEEKNKTNSGKLTVTKEGTVQTYFNNEFEYIMKETQLKHIQDLLMIAKETDDNKYSALINDFILPLLVGLISIIIAIVTT